MELVEEVPVRRTGMVVSKVEAAYGSPHPRSPDHLLVWQEPVVGRDGALSMRRVYRKLPGAALAGELVRESTWGAPAVVTARDVAIGTHADSGLGILESVVEPKDAQIARKRTTSVQWPALTSTRLNARGDVETVVESKVVPGTELPVATLATTELRLDAETVDRSRLRVGSVGDHAELADKVRGDAALIPARLRAAESYQVTDAIVTPSTEPDALSEHVVESKVAGKSRSQSVKRNTIRTGATLPCVTDRKLGSHGEVLESTESLVSLGTAPAAGFGISADSVRDTGTGLAVRNTVKLAPGQTYPVLSRTAYAHEADGEQVITTSQIVDPADPVAAALPPGGVKVLSARLEPIDNHHSRRIVSELAAEEFPVLSGKLMEHETRTLVTVAQQIVPAITVLDAPGPLVIEQKLRALDKWRSVQIITSLDALPSGFQEQKHLRFRFPGLYYDFDAVTGVVSYRHSITCVLPAKVDVSFGYAAVDLPLYEIKPVSWSYPSGFSVSEVLTNGEVIVYPATTPADSGTPVAEARPLPASVTLPLSAPTRKDYEALIGTYVPVTGATERWKGGVWRTEIWQVKLE